MTQNITDVSTFTSPIQSVADGDAASGANFLLAPQGLANRTKYLFDILKTYGITLIRSAASTSAMGALTGVTNGEACLVQGFGLYTYVSSSAATADGFLVVTASGMSGVGRWLHIMQSQANQNGGFAAIGVSGGSTNRIPQAAVPNGIVFTSSATISNTTITASAYADVTGMTTTYASAVAGDIIFVDTIWYSGSSGSGFTNAASVRTVVIDGGSTSSLPETVITQASSVFTGASYYTSATRYVVVNSGSITVKGQAQQTNGSYILTGPQTMVRVMIVRP